MLAGVRHERRAIYTLVVRTTAAMFGVAADVDFAVDDFGVTVGIVCLATSDVTGVIAFFLITSRCPVFDQTRDAATPAIDGGC